MAAGCGLSTQGTRSRATTRAASLTNCGDFSPSRRSGGMHDSSAAPARTSSRLPANLVGAPGSMGGGEGQIGRRLPTAGPSDRGRTVQQRRVRIARSQHAGDLRCAVIHKLRTARSLLCATDAAAIFYGGNVHMRSSRGRLSGSSVFLSGAFVAVWAAGAPAQVHFEGGTWSFRWVIHSKSCGTSISYPEGRRTVASGCFPDMTPIREKGTINIRPGELPTVGPLWPCTLARERREQLVSYVASRTHPRRLP